MMTENTLPKDPDLTNPAVTPAEKVKQQARETELNKAPNAVSPVGPNTVGANHPGVKTQSVHQGNSLPAAALPVNSKYENAQYVNPNANDTQKQ